MTYVITFPCVDLKDKACIEECPVDCIYEGDRMLYIQPDECVDCGACEPVCPVEAIYYEDDVPEDWKDYTAANAEFFADLGSPGGAAKVWKAEGAIVPGSGNAKFKARFFGLVSQEYWILDTAPDGAWAIMATPGGNYVWLMSRKAVMTPAAKSAALARIKALGYDTTRLEQPKQPPA